MPGEGLKLEFEAAGWGWGGEGLRVRDARVFWYWCVRSGAHFIGVYYCVPPYLLSLALPPPTLHRFVQIPVAMGTVL
jgi:hypothetical protein